MAGSFDDEDLKSWFKTHTAIEKEHSRSEGEGFLYAFRIDGVDYSDVTDCNVTNTAAYKVGRTVDPQRRELEWKRQCRSQTHTWFTPIAVDHCHSIERLVHAALEKICVSRPRKVCSDCGCTHHEIFLSSSAPDTFIDVIVPLIKEQNHIDRMAGRSRYVV
ncbi:hypothetical protein AAF712_014671 [Marasmius tenuissimus]|uniref:Bacteriophage T5 Orf172 DNA-binding domain-containing protein n=1 Tax=Marasmius tenuissimus TaxID=585030 RepID=A0ABR2ZBE2_9AGAR